MRKEPGFVKIPLSDYLPVPPSMLRRLFGLFSSVGTLNR